LAKKSAARPETFKAAAGECAAEQAEDPEGFAEEYGDGSEAFANCVAEHADEADDESEDDSEDEGSEEPDSDEDPAGEDEPAEPDEL
jgi:hypothetical protein